MKESFQILGKTDDEIDKLKNVIAIKKVQLRQQT